MAGFNLILAQFKWMDNCLKIPNVRDFYMFDPENLQIQRYAGGPSGVERVLLWVGSRIRSRSADGNASQEFNAMEYTQEVVNVYDDKNLPTATNQTYFEGVAYIDKHPQPSPHADMPDLVKEYYGKMTAKNIVQNFPRLMESGDVHIALYDFGEKQALPRRINR